MLPLGKPSMCMWWGPSIKKGGCRTYALDDLMDAQQPLLGTARRLRLRMPRNDQVCDALQRQARGPSTIVQMTMSQAVLASTPASPGVFEACALDRLLAYPCKR